LAWRGLAATTINSGYDEFNTPSDGSSYETLNLPQGFFVNSSNFPSDAISTTMTFRGGNTVPGFPTDTVVERTNDVNVPGDTPIILTGLRVVGTQQVTAHFPNGTAFVTYDVSVQESETPSTGRMSFSSNNTFTIEKFLINRVYTFVPTDTSQPTKVADSLTSLNPDGSPVFQPFDLGGGGGQWFGSGHNVIVVPSKHQTPTHAHVVIQPSPTPTPSPSPVPTMTVKPIPGM